MTIYPQLSTGAACQYPIKKTIAYRTISNSLEDGSRITLTDFNATRINWDLTYSGLTDAELSELRSFFESVEGRLSKFTYLDPTANLLVWSENLAKPAWQANTFLSLQTEIADPLGTLRATRVTNSTEGSLSLIQTISIPATLNCCWSVYARSDSGAALSLTHDESTIHSLIASSWKRVNLSAPGNGTADSSDFGITIPPGSQVDLFGLQVLAQPAPSRYTSTLNVSGVYPETRFDSDVLESVEIAPNSNMCQVSLYSRTI